MLRTFCFIIWLRKLVTEFYIRKMLTSFQTLYISSYLAYTMDLESHQRDSIEENENRTARITRLHLNTETKTSWSSNKMSKI